MADKSLVSLRDARERTIAILSDLFAKDDLDLDDFEKRVSLVHRAGNVAEVDQVIADLSVSGSDVKRQPAAALVPVSSVRPTETIVAVMGGTSRTGPWTAPRHLRVAVFMGGTQLDFREARLAPGVTEVSIFAFMGGAQIIVPPELSVETHGIAIMGGFEHLDRQPPQLDPDRPVLRVHGFAMMGGVAIETRLAGEDEREAQRRRKRERKALRRRNDR